MSDDDGDMCFVCHDGRFVPETGCPGCDRPHDDDTDGDDTGDALDAIADDLGTVGVTDAELSTECRAPDGEAFGYDPDR